MALTGCVAEAPTPREACVQRALAQPQLQHGVAAFTQPDGGMGTASHDWHGRFRLATGYRYIAASLTKPLVADAVRRAIDHGALSLDARVAPLLPEAWPRGEGTGAITVRHLLQHTAAPGSVGGRDPLFFPGYRIGQPDCAVTARFALSLAPARTPGTRVEYSNAGYCILAEVLQAVQRRPPGAAFADARLQAAMAAPYGGAGGWREDLAGLYQGLHATLPIHALPSPPTPLDDGSWYGYGWRWWPASDWGPHWTHTGRLQGIVSVALSDGRDRLLVAHFDGDPTDYQAAAAVFSRQAWACLQPPADASAAAAEPRRGPSPP